MGLIAKHITDQLSTGSWIRKMFESGIQLKKQYGENEVYDFSLGNPDLAPPNEVSDAITNVAELAKQPFGMSYMPNAGFKWARDLLASHLTNEQGIKITGDDVILTCGAAGALNVFFHSILNSGDEVLALRPCFVEYGNYVQNHGGIFNTVQTIPDTFAPDLNALDSAINKNTRALIINNPNNPTGVVYNKQQLKAIIEVLTNKSAQYGRPIFLVIDEPYRTIVFDDIQVPSAMPLYRYSVLASSFSKSMSIPGERIGYLAISSELEQAEHLTPAFIFSNRVLGFVNAPIIGQYIIRNALGATSDSSVYLRRRNLLANILSSCGYQFHMPQGTFYIFPKAPGGDDISFVGKNLLDQRILAVPGSGFFGPGYFRLAFCVEDEVILRSADKFKSAIKN